MLGRVHRVARTSKCAQQAIVGQTMTQTSIRKESTQPKETTKPRYTDVSQDPPASYSFEITPETIQERVQKKYDQHPTTYTPAAEKVYDAVIIGGGHNGLVTAGYLAKAGHKVLVLERRHTVGGAAVSEQIVPGFTFSRASYLAGLLRPQIIKDLELEKYGFEYIPRDPSSFTPTLPNSPSKGKYLLLGSDAKMTYDSIAQFSVRDADAFPAYEDFLGKVRDVVSPLLDSPPMQGTSQLEYDASMTIVKEAYRHRDVLAPFYELFTGK